MDEFLKFLLIENIKELLIKIKKYSYSPLNISKLYFLKWEFEHDDLGWLVVGLNASELC